MTTEAAVAYLEQIQKREVPGSFMQLALHAVIAAAKERAAAVEDLERLLWIDGGPCKYCAKSNGKGGHSKLDRPCIPCEPKWRGKRKEVNL